MTTRRKVVHCPAYLWAPERGSLCSERRRGTAIRAEEVTCRTCLSWPDRIRETFEGPVNAGGMPIERMSEDHQARLQRAVDEIAGERAGCRLTRISGSFHWRWDTDSHCANGWADTPDQAIAAACRTLRAALGVPEPREVKLREALLCMLMSADAAWEENRGGHDWPEACELAREALGVAGEPAP